jgi:DUF4097 and DUF4098 domain-containing protein YvlB
MSARKLLLLIFVLGLGASVETAWQVREHVGLGATGCRVLRGRFHGPSFSYESETTERLAAGASLEVQNAFGAVHTRIGPPGEVKVTLRKVVFLPTEEKAREFASRITLSASHGPSSLLLASNRDELDRSHPEVGFETHLELALPPDTSLKVRSEHGAVQVADVAQADVTGSFDSVRVERVKGDATIEARHGDVYALGVGGALALSARHGDVELEDVSGASRLDVEHGAVKATRTGALDVKLAHGGLEARDVRGDLVHNGRHSGVEATGVEGATRIETAYDGVRLSDLRGEVRIKAEHARVEVSDARAAVSVESSYDGVTLARIAGPVEVAVTHGGLDAESIEQGLRVKASGDSVEVDGFSGPAQIEAQRSSVRLVAAAPVTSEVSVTTTHGSIELAVPTDSRFELDASSRRGEVSIELPGFKTSRTEEGRLLGTFGAGGARVQLSADHGSVTVSAATNVAQR